MTFIRTVSEALQKGCFFVSDIVIKAYVFSIKSYLLGVNIRYNKVGDRLI